MRQTLFIADLHLYRKKPQTVAVFFKFLNVLKTKEIDDLYILGDLFEYWLGDDDNSVFNQQIAKALSDCADYFPIYFSHGNRDFLLGDIFAKQAKIHLLDEITKIELYGNSTLVMHGDILCTDDVDYQQFRLKVRNNEWKKRVANYPLWLRGIIAAKMRWQSKFANKNKSKADDYIMDVNIDSVIDVLREYNASQLIHGHTHRPGNHNIAISAENRTEITAKRLVTSDWLDINIGDTKIIVADKSDIYLENLANWI